MFLSLDRTDRIFGNFLDLQDGRLDTADNGFTADDRRVAVKKLRFHRRARNSAADQSYETFLNDKDEGYKGTFLEWLIANQDKVLQIIMTIISLFGL